MRQPSFCGRAAVALLVLLAAGCSLQKTTEYACTAEHPECPGGMVCRADKCVAQGSVADGGHADGARPDGRLPDAAPGPDLGDSCGDGQRNGSEACDGEDLGGASCASLGYFKGTLTCDRACRLDESLCTRCGDGQRDLGEDCDGADLGNQTCQDVGFDSGALGCGPDCAWNTDECRHVNCGNGTVDGSEQCDGVNLAGKTCVDLLYAGGDLGCKPNCAFDEAGCYKCGDGLINGPAGGEICDGANLGVQTCKTQGFDGGVLACAADCTALDTTGCYECGDNRVDPGEQCDKTALGGQTCASQGFDGGNLACTATCSFDTAACFKCGDGKVNGSEECDGSDFGGKTCATWTFGGGTLTCTGCKISKATCTTAGYVTAPAGTFAMGAPDSEPCRSTYTNDAELQHHVQLTRAFEISATETTQAEFSSRMGYNPSSHTTCGASCPVENLSWSEMAAYCNALSTLRGLAACYTCTGSGAAVSCSDAWGANIYACPGYRLPTDAEWEYAYRAGQTTAYHNGYNGNPDLCLLQNQMVDPIGWYYYAGQSGEPRPVKQKAPNAWGLYDMAGNVGEKIHDYYNDAYTSAFAVDPVNVTGTYRTTRGGDAGAAVATLRAASHTGNPLDSRWKRTGFRSVRSR